LLVIVLAQKARRNTQQKRFTGWESHTGEKIFLYNDIFACAETPDTR
jgi:hypothetical protein